MQTGKLPFGLLSELLSKIDVRDPRVVLGPKPGEDAAIIDFDDRYLVAKTDPVTFATDLIGWYLVNINVNDLAVMGATPHWLMVTIMLPEGTSPSEISGIFDQLIDACKIHNVALIGGHTEITYDLPRPVAVGAILGEVAKDKVVLSSGVMPGDSLILTKGIAIEGTAILAREASNELIEAGLLPTEIDRARNLLFSPGISVAKDANVAVDVVDVHAMHDPTEGGLATGLFEMGKAANVGLIVDLEKIMVVPECMSVCNALGLDPLGLIASGALLAAVDSKDTSTLLGALGREGIEAYEIARATPLEQGFKVRTTEGMRELPMFERDELARYLGKHRE